MPKNKTIKLDSTAQISKLVRAEDEEFFVYGVVIEPEQGTDINGDPLELISVEETRRAAHDYMRRSQEFTKEHYTWVSHKVRIVESYLAPVDFEIGEVEVKRGSWVMGLKVLDTELWGAVKRGDITGFSIGGQAKTLEGD